VYFHRLTVRTDYEAWAVQQPTSVTLFPNGNCLQVDNLTHANVLHNTLQFICTLHVTNDHWNASIDCRKFPVSPRGAIEQFFVSQDNNSSCTYSLFLPTGTFLVVHRSVSLIFPFALTDRSYFFYFSSSYFCAMNKLILFSVSTTLSFQILFLPILGYSGFDIKNIQIIRSSNGWCVSVGRPNLMALSRFVP
jgi:hypothetical protein